MLSCGIAPALDLDMTIKMVSVRKVEGSLTVDAMQAAKIQALITSALQGGK